jgi:hypothetical protein
MPESEKSLPNGSTLIADNPRLPSRDDTPVTRTRRLVLRPAINGTDRPELFEVGQI